MMSLAETFLTIFLYNLFIFLFRSYLLLTAFAFFYLLLSSLLCSDVLSNAALLSDTQGAIVKWKDFTILQTVSSSLCARLLLIATTRH